MINQRKQGYDLHSLSEDEKNRFTEALGDGFGHSHRNKQMVGLNLPTEVRSGLLEHRAFFENRVMSESEEEYEEDEFWDEPDDDSPPGLFEQCPLNFHMPTIRSYFAEQKKAYLNRPGIAGGRFI